MLTPEQIEAAKVDASLKLYKEHFDKQVQLQVDHLKAQRGHIFPKKITFQWPIKLVPHYKQSSCCG